MTSTCIPGLINFEVLQNLKFKEGAMKYIAECVSFFFKLGFLLLSHKKVKSFQVVLVTDLSENMLSYSFSYWAQDSIILPFLFIANTFSLAPLNMSSTCVQYHQVTSSLWQ